MQGDDRAGGAPEDPGADFRRIADFLPAIVWLTDEEDRCIYVSPPWSELTGKESGKGLVWQELVHPHDRDEVLARCRAAIERRAPLNVTYRLRQFDGSWRWVLDVGAPRLAADGSYLGYAGLVIDIENRKDVERGLGPSEQRFRDFAESASDWLWETDPEGRLVFLSSRIERLLDRPIEDLLGHTRAEIGIDRCGDERLWKHYDALLAARRPFRDFHYQVLDARGIIRHLRISGRPVHDEAGVFIGYRGTGSDITAEVKAQEQARYLALHDPLTGLPNRVRFADRLADAVAMVRRGSEKIAVLCLDLDHFKEVNDILGHAIGDRLLQEVARRLLVTVREVDTVARLGGDEFAIIQVGLAQPEGVEALCRRLVARIAEPIRIEEHDIFVGLSIGAALSPEDSLCPEELLKDADIALYKAKAEGRGVFRLFSAEMDAALRVRKALEQDLRQALRRGQLEMHYQPLVESSAGKLVAVEALMRWRHPQKGLVSPADFIPIAEASGLILPLGEWALRTACAQAVHWPGVTVSVNLSPVQFRHDDLVGLVRQVLDSTGLPSGRLELEVTEGILLQDTEDTLLTLTRLKEMGVRIAMDDFGTGYSSLRYLHRFAFDKVKIDRSFVSMLEKDSNAAAIVRAVVSLGRSLGIVTTAEGVETSTQLEFLRAEGCDQVQGYHLGRPQPAADLTRCFIERQAAEPSAPASEALLFLTDRRSGQLHLSGGAASHG